MEKMHYKFADREIESIEQVQQEMAQDILSGRPFMAGLEQWNLRICVPMNLMTGEYCQKM